MSELAARLKQAVDTAALADSTCPHCLGWGVHRYRTSRTRPWQGWFESVEAPDSLRSAMPHGGYSSPICPACHKVRATESYLVLGAHLMVKVHDDD